MKKISIMVLLLLLIIPISIFAQGDKEKATSEGSVGKPVILIAATNNPKSSGHYKGMEIFQKLVEERTGGAVKVELYADAVLGDEEQMIEGMQMGTVDVMMAAAAKYANFVPEMDIYSPPYTFKSWDHFKAVMDSDIQDTLTKVVKERRGDIYLGCLTDGNRNIFTRKPVHTLADLSGMKIRTMTGPNETNSYKALGMNPTPLAYTELYAALQSGVVDGAENTFASILGMKFYESCKNVLLTGHNYLALPMFISQKAIEKIPAQYRDMVVQAGKDTVKQQVDWAIQNDLDCEETLRSQYGVNIYKFSTEDLNKSIELCVPVQNDNAKRIGMEEALATIRELGKKM
jgi:tripartite ATP-independent transporter DctP family solute receptor